MDATKNILEQMVSNLEAKIIKLDLTSLLSLKYISDKFIIKMHKLKIEGVLELYRVKVFLLWIREIC